jgi:hypothetical protein
MLGTQLQTSFPHLFQDPIYSSTLHLSVLCTRSLLIIITSCSLPFMILTLESTSQVFCWMSLNFCLSGVLSWLDSGSMLGELLSLLLHHDRAYTYPLNIICDVNVGHLVNMVSARYLHHKITIVFLSILHSMGDSHSIQPIV